MKKQLDRQYNLNRRGANVQKLALQWLKVHRPDVVEAIREEVEKMFPIGARKTNIKLPSSLVSFK